MTLVVLSVICMLIVAYAQFREGLFTAVTTLINVFIAGIVTFNFWEPLANLLDSAFQGMFLEGYEDWLVLTTLFCVTLVLLRVATNNLAPLQVHFAAVPQQIGGAVVGMITGYFVAGFLTCVAQTLPWHENFLDFQPYSSREPGMRRLFPPDRVWLAAMRHAGAYPFSRAADDYAESEKDASRYDEHPTFDSAGTFELRYLRYRRYSDQRSPLPYQGELEPQLRRIAQPGV